jgi:hypothetical protein
MIKLVVTDEEALRADAADLVGTVLDDIYHQLQGTQYVFLVGEMCDKHQVAFSPSRVAA